jgi:acyl dehydratase
MTETEIRAFAAQYDPQPFHTDPEAARETFFQGLAASGWHTGAVTMRLMVESIPVAGGLVGAGVEEFRWFKPVRPGDTLRVQSEVLTARASQSKPNQGIVRVRHTTFNQHDEAVQRFISTMVVPKQPVESEI